MTLKRETECNRAKKPAIIGLIIDFMDSNPIDLSIDFFPQENIDTLGNEIACMAARQK